MPMHFRILRTKPIQPETEKNTKSRSPITSPAIDSTKTIGQLKAPRLASMPAITVIGPFDNQ